MNPIIITITEHSVNHLVGTTASGETAEYFAVSDTWYIGERIIRPWEAWIIVKYA